MLFTTQLWFFPQAKSSQYNKCSRSPRGVEVSKSIWQNKKTTKEKTHPNLISQDKKLFLGWIHGQGNQKECERVFVYPIYNWLGSNLLFSNTKESWNSFSFANGVFAIPLYTLPLKRKQYKLLSDMSSQQSLTYYLDEACIIEE